MNSKKVNWLYLSITLIHIAVVAGINFYVCNIGPLHIPIVLNLLLSQGIVLIPAILFLCISKEKWNAVLGFRKMKISSVLMTVLFTYLMMPMTTVINAISMLFVDNTVMQMSNSVLQMPAIVMVSVMGIIGPLSEEIVFRGVVFSGYKRSGNAFRSILFSALLFGLMHMNFNQAAYAIFLGIVMAVLVETTGSLWSSVVFHMTVNIQNVLLMFLTDTMTSDAYMQEAQAMVGDKDVMLATIGIYAVIATVTTSIAVCVLAWIAKNEHRENHLKQIWIGRKENRGQLVSIPLIIGIVLSVAYMILDVIMS